MSYKIYFDAGKKNNTIKYGCVVYLNDDIIFTHNDSFEDKTITSNDAEYISLIVATYIAYELGLKDVVIYGDSQVVINHACGIRKSRSKRSKNFRSIFLQLAREFDKIDLFWINRSDNNVAHRICR